MAIQTVAVTGGNGKLGRAVLETLTESGYEAVNIARGKQREEVSDGYYTTDLLDAGQVYGALARSDSDAVIHMGTIPGPQNHSGYVTYESNVMSTYHILEAAQSLELETACLASSINVMGSAYQAAPVDARYLPVDEVHPVTPRDPYALGKHALEVTADGFGRLDREPITISSLRYPWVATADELRETFTTSDRTMAGLEDAWHHTTRDTFFSYIHIADAADIAQAAIEADYAGHERFWAVASDTTADVPSSRIADEYYPEVEIRRELDGTESLISTEKASDLLGWEPERSWRDC
jgi:nucleoside-diphosphate-sugar epimerase